MDPRQPPLVRRMAGFGSTVFAEMSALALRTGAVNLGQGFPDTDGPQSLLDDACAAIQGGRNQYPPGPGVPELRAAIAEHQRRFHGLEVDPDGGVLVTVGATEAIAATLLALCEPGDEVVALEPFYDSYAASIALAGAVLKPVPLLPPAFRPDPERLAAAFSDRTRVVLVNTPHNPTGAVLSREDLQTIADLAVAHGALVVTDEVYEHMAYDRRSHVPMASLPGMADRTLTISSAAKTFSVTGWKVGWVTGPADLVRAVQSVKQFLTFVGSGPMQPAVAAALALPDEFYDGLRTRLQDGRDLLVSGLAKAGFDVHVPDGGYFVLADAAPLGFADGYDLCLRLPELAGVVGVPVTPFCVDPGPFRSLVRFAFCKRPEVLEQAAEGLARLGG